VSEDQFSKVIAGKFGGKYSPQSLLAVMAQDAEVDGFVMIVSRRNPKNPYEFVLVNVEEAESLAFMAWMMNTNVTKLLSQGLPEIPPDVAA
jgi:hypothetical protein